MSEPVPRRAVVTGLATATAACVGRPFDGGQPTHETARSPQTVVEQSSLTFTTSIERQPSTDAPGVISLRLRNDGTEPERLVFGAAPPFSDLLSEAVDGHRRVLLPVGDDAYTSPPVDELLPAESDGCWTVTSEFDVVQSERPRTLNPGESIDRRYRTASWPGAGGCQPGTFTFSQLIRTNPDDPVPAFRTRVEVTVTEDRRLSVVTNTLPP